MRKLIIASAIVALGTMSATAASPGLGDLGKVGTVDFPTSCNAQAQPEFVRGVALLHSFFYEEARRVFTVAATKDPKCAMAYWGVAMTWYHPIWAPPSADDLKAGMAAVEKAESITKVTPRERDYIASIAAFYRAAKENASGPVGMSCHGPTDYVSRRASFTKAMEQLHAKYPDDIEAATFYALSRIKSSPTPAEIPNQLEAAAILEPIYKAHPNHPGAVHYLIHAYDYPTLATKGLPAADHYASIAPWVPHALHMPSHIYTRLGMWQKSIASNTSSAEAAREYQAKYHPEAANAQELHALDYLAYGYLQTAQDAKAREVAVFLTTIKKTIPAVDFAAAYAGGAIPARLALERQAWADAAALPPAEPLFVAKFPFDAAHVEYARALGCVRTKDIDGTRKAAARIQKLHDESTDPGYAYFRRQLELQQIAVKGWIAWAEGSNDEAIAFLRYAADEEDILGKHPVSPGSILPIRELLGDLYLELNRPADALVAYEQSLMLNPERYRAIAGAALAAERASKTDTARAYYTKLLELAKPGDGTRPEIAQARAYLAKAGGAVAAR